jgi:hypothetical protein
MNIIKDQREDVIRENNTAQDYLVQYLETLNRRATTVDIREPLHGDLDFSVIRSSDFMSITSILLVEGEITSIQNIPEGITTFVCPKNLLFALEDLPSSLESIDVPYNYLSTIRLTQCVKLQHVNVSHNALERVDPPLPKTITKLFLSNNQLTYLNLQGLDVLSILNVSNNKLSVIDYLPESVTSLLIDNNPSIEFRNGSNVTSLRSDENEPEEMDAQQNMNYVQSVFDYFRIKREYETKLYEARKKVFNYSPNKKIGKRNASEVKAKCIQCARPVGTIFSVRDNRYIALCGSTDSPCALNIEIYNGHFSCHQDLIYSFKEDMEEMKDTIIKQKLDTLFSYVTEEQSIELFKKELETYNLDSMIYKTLLDTYEEKHANPHTMGLIEKKQTKVYRLVEDIQGLLREYEKTENKDFLQTAVQIQVNDLLPEVQNIRILSFELMEMQQKKHNNGRIENFLFKNDVALTKLDHNIAEPPRVIKFQFRGRT